MSLAFARKHTVFAYGNIEKPSTSFGKEWPVDLQKADPNVVSAKFPSPRDFHKLRGKRVGVVLFSNYPADPRPRRAAEAMANAGMHVDLICLGENEPCRESIQGVNVFRVSLQNSRGGKRAYFFEYGRFLLESFWWLSRNAMAKRYDIVHVHNMPDVLVFSSLIAKAFGSRVILDLHDPMPELFQSIYKMTEKALLVRVLRFLERCSTHYADLVLCPNIAFRDLFASRSRTPSKIHMVMNSPQEAIFTTSGSGDKAFGTKKSGCPFTVMYHGSLVERHGLDIAVRAIASLTTQIPNLRFRIYGRHTPYMDSISRMIRELKLEAIVTYHGPKSLQEIAGAIQECDLGVIPNRRSPFIELNMPTRIFEYLAMNKPVIAPETRGIRDYFELSDLMFFNGMDAADLADKILWISKNPGETSRIVERGRAIYDTHRWSNEEKHLLELTTSLID